MFVGYEIKNQQNQAKPLVLETDIKLSQAVLDPSKGNKKDPVCLIVEYNKKQFILAVLDPTRSWQCPLDLMFSAGSEVKFFIRGTGSVHLTGFEYREDMDDQFAMDMTSDEEEVEDDDDEVEEKVTIKAAKKPIQVKKTNGVGKVTKKDDKKKSLSGDQTNGNGDADDDDDDEDDEDFDSDMMDQDDDMFEDSDEEEDLDSDIDEESSGEDEEEEE